MRKPVPPDNPVYEFEDFRLDVTHLMLYRNSETVPLTPKQVETLAVLVEKRGEVVAKDELMSRLWGNTAVEESNLSQNLYILRKTLGTRSDGKPLIETFRRRGYRFNGELRQSSEIEVLVTAHTKTTTFTEEEISEQPYSETPGAPRVFPAKVRRNLFFTVAALVAGLVLIFGVSRFFQARSARTQLTTSAAALPVVKLSRVTPDLNIGDSAISPDGKYLAYNTEENGKNILWLKDLATGSTLQIMPPNEKSYGDLHFSPNGKQVYYGSFLKTSPNVTIFRIPFSGGEAHEVVRNVISPLTISPDGKQIAFVRGSTAESTLVIADAGGGQERILKTRKKTEWFETWGSNLSWSPDGSRIAICGAQAIGSRGHYELVEVSVKDGSERRIPIPNWNYVDDVQWLSDESGLVVVARETEVSPWQIWRITYPNGEVSRITNDMNNYDDLSLSSDSHVLVTQQKLGNLNLWILPFADPEKASQVSFGNAASDGRDGMAFTPDGKVIYSSPRAGNVDLWQMNADGTEQKQLTKNSGDFNGRPRVTTDGRLIVFVSSRSGSRQIWRMEVDGGNSQQLTRVRVAEFPSLSPDGRWVYFSLLEEQKYVIAKVPIDGGEPVRVSESDDYFVPLAISPDGKRLFVSFYDRASEQPWKNGVMSLDSGEMLKIFLEPIHRVGGWTADDALVCVLENQSNLWLLPISGGPRRPLTHFKSGQIREFAISPDFKLISVSRGNPSSEAVLINMF